MRGMDACADAATARGAAAVRAAAAALPGGPELAVELACADRASARGYFLPDEDALVRVRYSQYLTLRAALLGTLEELAAAAGADGVEWRGRLPAFATAFAAACLLLRATRFIVDLAKDRPVVWKKLDEEDRASGTPRKSFTAIYSAASSVANLRRFLVASDFYFSHRQEILALPPDTPAGGVAALLLEEEPMIERRRRDALKRLFAYRWFSFLRRHRSAWRQVMFGLFRISGSTIAELRQPGVKPAGAPKRITEDLRGRLLAKARPGDVFVTRHDDAMSNLFLPGFWPHAALYLGMREELEAAGIDLPAGPGHWFLEAKKDGVKIRPAAETLQVDACVVLRPPLPPGLLSAAIARALSHEGKGYDFLFDFRTADVLACTEVIYRGFHGAGSISFRLLEVGGRLCLPAEEMLDQAMDCGFRVTAAAGIGRSGCLAGTKAEIAFHGSRTTF